MSNIFYVPLFGLIQSEIKVHKHNNSEKGIGYPVVTLVYTAVRKVRITLKKILMKIFLLSVILPFLILSVGHTQNSEFGNWFIYFGDVKTNNRWNWHHEVQYRNFNIIGDIDQILLRTGLGYNLTENNNNVHLGYAYIYNESYVNNSDIKMSSSENRLYQQYITRQSYGRFSWLHRYRFEQRFFKEDFKLRLRYFLSFNVALNKTEMTDKTLYLSFYNEIFTHTSEPYFDRNRLYGGMGYRFSKKIRSEIGWMRQTLQNSSRNQINIITFMNI